MVQQLWRDDQTPSGKGNTKIIIQKIEQWSASMWWKMDQQILKWLSQSQQSEDLNEHADSGNIKSS